ncbi:methylglyoxal synthase [Marinagarivorans algicola]|uniref:methylglyoxal synthase n=1 Tax=Marinagarivorans algicola TaxID=1513270 RepID=UPI0006B93A8E|nr:methylglyoxal synthase [Marinagarivorans algicola]
MDFTLATLPQHKTIALVAHDNRKKALIEWVSKHKQLLSLHALCATGTTGQRIEQAINIPVRQFLSGPLGGDQQIGGQIAEGSIHCLIFFWDPFEPMPHDPDVKALLRLASVWNIPVACNSSTADLMISSPLFTLESVREIPDYTKYSAQRTSQEDS